jgi:parallel beta-helix repeat protein
MLLKAFQNAFARGGRNSLVRRRRPRFNQCAAEVLEGRQLLAATLWVDPASNHPGDFHTIQAAVNAATAGDTIKVAPAVYAESVTVPTSLTILGGQIHLPGETGASIVQSHTVGFTISADSVTLKNFTIQMSATAIGQSPIGVLAMNTAGSKIDNNTIRSDAGAAIVFGGGVTDTDADRNNLKSVVGPVGTGGSDGIEFDTAFSAADNSHDQIVGNVIHEFGDGIVIGGTGTTGDTQVVGNVVSNSSDDGIENLSEDNALIANFVTHAGDTGIASSANSVTLLANFVSGSAKDGIDCTGTGPSTLIGNTADNNGLTGISVPGANSSFVFGNTGDGNQFFGISVIGDHETVAFNTANHNKLNGLSAGGISCLYVANTANDNGNYGMNITGISTTIIANTANNNTLGGYFISVSASTLVGNTAARNGTDGFVLFNFQSSTVSDNTANRNGGDGFHLVNAVGNTLNGNVARNNSADGIDVDSMSSGNTIENNTAVNNTVDDLFDASTGGGTAGTANTWSNNTANTRSPAGLS